MNTAPLLEVETAARAVALMNRGHALLVRNDRSSFVRALANYEEAVVLLRSLPVSENPRWANSLCAALMNCGHLLHRIHATTEASAALRRFDEASVVLARLDFSAVPWARRNLAGTLLNRASLRLDLFCAGATGELTAATADARRALDLVRDRERSDITDADLALKARRALCDALGQSIQHASAARQDEIADEAAERVDDALAIIRHWTACHVSAFDELAVRFFRFGARLYRRHQPHFLLEFIEENRGLAPASVVAMREIICEALEGTLSDAASTMLVTLGDPRSERALETHLDIATARDRLLATTSPL